MVPAAAACGGVEVFDYGARCRVFSDCNGTGASLDGFAEGEYDVAANCYVGCVVGGGICGDGWCGGVCRIIDPAGVGKPEFFDASDKVCSVTIRYAIDNSIERSLGIVAYGVVCLVAAVDYGIEA